MTEGVETNSTRANRTRHDKYYQPFASMAQ